MPEFMRRYGPSVISALVFVVLAFRNLWEANQGAFSIEDRYVLAIAAVNTVVTYIIPNLSGSWLNYAKLITNAALVALAFFVKAQTGDGDITMAEWIDGIVLTLGALGALATVGPVWNASNLRGTGPTGVRP